MLHVNLPRNRIFIFLVIGITIFAIPFTVFLAKQQQETRSRASGPTFGADTVALVNGEPISKSDYEKSKACLAEKNPNDPQIDDKALDVTVDEKVLSKWAKDNKVQVSNKEVNDEAVRISGLNPSDCQKKLAKVSILRNKLAENLVKFREGKVIVINFDRYLPPLLARDNLTDTERTNLNEEEITKAGQFIKSLYADLKSKKITFEEAIEKAKSDSYFGDKNWYGNNPSGDFSASAYIEKTGLLSSEMVRAEINKLNPGEFSEPFLQQVNYSADPAQQNLTNVRWIIVRVDRAVNGSSGSSGQLLNSIRQKYNTQILK